jgi:hypothetical protein
MARGTGSNESHFFSKDIAFMGPFNDTSIEASIVRPSTTELDTDANTTGTAR